LVRIAANDRLANLLSYLSLEEVEFADDFEYTDSANPPAGSSGLTLQVQISELLEGYRPGRIGRFRPNAFPNVKLPPEERVKNMNDR